MPRHQSPLTTENLKTVNKKPDPRAREALNGWNALNSWNQRLLSRFTMAPEFASVSCYLSIAVYCPRNYSQVDVDFRIVGERQP